MWENSYLLNKRITYIFSHHFNDSCGLGKKSLFGLIGNLYELAFQKNITIAIYADKLFFNWLFLHCLVSSTVCVVRESFISMPLIKRTNKYHFYENINEIPQNGNGRQNRGDSEAFARKKGG